MKKNRPALAFVNEKSLRDYALRYLARFDASKQGVGRILFRHIDRLKRRSYEKGITHEEIGDLLLPTRKIVEKVVASLETQGIINDVRFACSRMKSLIKTGHSLCAIKAHLIGKGIDEDQVNAILNENEDDLDAVEKEHLAILVFMRRHKWGPFCDQDQSVSLERRKKMVAAMVKAGFPIKLIFSMMELPKNQASEKINILKRQLF